MRLTLTLYEIIHKKKVNYYHYQQNVKNTFAILSKKSYYCAADG